jgi:hypothetical protein
MVFYSNYSFLVNPTIEYVNWDGVDNYYYAISADEGWPGYKWYNGTLLKCFKDTIGYYMELPDFFADFSPDSSFRDPVFVDINRDNKLDLLIQQDYMYSFYENMGSLSNPIWEKRPQWSNNLRNTKHYRAEAADLTGDGLIDIVFGNKDGSLTFLHNFETDIDNQWKRDNRVFEGVKIDSTAIPTLYDLDWDGDLDLILGDHQGRFYAFRNDSPVSVDVEPDYTESPQRFIVNQNYPNPFNPETNISFKLAKSEYVSIVIYNALGQRIKSLVSEQKPAGNHIVMWNGTNDSGSKVSSGLYLYRITAGEFTSIRKMLLIK